MALTETEVRVLAALIEKEAAVPESYPLTLNALRLACNQTTNRRPVVSYDDRTVEAALLSLKSVGLVRFVHPSHGGRTTRYRHTADERWHLSHGELLVLSALALRGGAQTVAEIRRVSTASSGGRVVDGRGAARHVGCAQPGAVGRAHRPTPGRARRAGRGVATRSRKATDGARAVPRRRAATTAMTPVHWRPEICRAGRGRG